MKNSKMDMKKFSLFLLLVFVIFSSCAQPNYQKILVVKVIDGDTLRLSTGEHLRLIGIDSPEQRYNKKLERDAKRSGEDARMIIAKGQAAYEFARSLAEDKVIQIEFDEERYDDYGRLLGYAFLADGTFINLEIVKAGFARPLTIRPNVRYADSFYNAYLQAKEMRKGNWK